MQSVKENEKRRDGLHGQAGDRVVYSCTNVWQTKAPARSAVASVVRTMVEKIKVEIYTPPFLKGS
jgi:hypothetical protein